MLTYNGLDGRTPQTTCRGKHDRIFRICETDVDFEKQADDMIERFHNRGYQESWLSEAKNIVWSKNRSNLFQKSKKEKKVFSHISLHTWFAKISIQSTVLQHWHILSTDPQLKDVFVDPPLFSHYKSS